MAEATSPKTSLLAHSFPYGLGCWEAHSCALCETEGTLSLALPLPFC